MDPASKSLATRLTFVVAKRLAAILLPLGFGLGDFISAAKAAFIEAATEQIKRRGDRPSTARIAVVTGLSRAEVAKVRLSEQVPSRPFAEPRTERVMYGWFADSRYVDAAGIPLALPMTGPRSFDELVRKYSGDIPRRAVLAELLAGGMAEVTASGSIKALRRHYLLASGHPVTDLESLTTDIDVLLRGATNSREGGGSAVRRISVVFPEGIPLSVRRTVALRTERFLEGLADYLHASAMAPPQHLGSTEGRSPVFHLMITECQADSKD